MKFQKFKFCPSCGAPATIDQANQDMDYNNRQLDDQDHKQARKERYQDLRKRVESYKPMWDKDGVIQFKSDHGQFYIGSWECKLNS